MSSEPVRWCVITDLVEKDRFECLSEALNEVGFENSFHLIKTSVDQLEDAVRQAKNEFQQIRIGGALRDSLLLSYPRLTSTVATLRTCDSLVQHQSPAGVDWWPRCFLVDGFLATFANGSLTLDLTGQAFILGATPDTRAVVAALVRVGFTKFNIADLDEARGHAMIEELRRTYFNIQFQFVSRHLITQMPGLNSFAVNFLQAAESDGVLDELVFFNFLKSGGVWLDFPLVPGSPALDSEAWGVGAQVIPSARVLALADQAWAQFCWGFKIDCAQLEARLAARREPEVFL